MKKFPGPMLFILVVGLIAGCSSPKPSVGFAGGVRPPDDPNIKYSIQPLQDGNNEKDHNNYPRASAVMTSAVQASLLKHGKQVVTDGGGDVVISGYVTAFYRGNFAGRYTTVGLNLQAIDKKTGVIVWNANLSKSTKFKYDYDPALLANEVADDLLNHVFDKQ